tara:strand:+ start:830 stop:3076 length:2247 start_codon:yes stop_codon:yes gene_type:complete
MSRTALRSKTAAKSTLDSSMYRKGQNYSASMVEDTYTWVRNPQWIAMPSFSAGEQKVAYLFAVYEDFPYTPRIYTTFVTTTHTGTVDWGDGTSQTVAHGGYAEKTYNYSALPANNGVVSFGSNLVTLSSHGHTNNQRVMFNSSTASAVEKHVRYFVVNATTNTFQLSLSEGGAPITIGTGTGALLGYKQVIITVSSTNAFSQVSSYHNSTYISVITDNNILQATISLPDATIASARNYSLERADYVGTGNISFSSGVAYSYGLKSVNIESTVAISDLSSCFYNCYNLKEVSTINAPNCTSINSTFTGCYNLISPPKFINLPTSGVSITNAFNGCLSMKKPVEFFTNPTNIGTIAQHQYGLKAPHYFNSTSSCTNVSNLYYYCLSIAGHRYYDFSSCTSIHGPFYYNTQIRTIPGYNLSASTSTFNHFFSSCTNLVGIPKLDFSTGTAAISLIGDCYRLKRVKYPIDISSATAANNIFYHSKSLREIHSITTTSALTNIASAFTYAQSLKYIPLFDTSECTSAYYMFHYCTNLKELPAFDFTKITRAELAVSYTYQLDNVTLNLPAATNLNQLCVGSLVKNVDISAPVATNVTYVVGHCWHLEKVKISAPSSTSFTYGMYYPGHNNSGHFSDIQLDLSSCTDFSYAFSGTPYGGESSLTYIPTMDMSAATNMTNTFAYNPRLVRMKATGIGVNFSLQDSGLSSTALDEVYTNLADLTGLTGATITVTSNPGVAQDTPSIATSKNWTVTG